MDGSIIRPRIFFIAALITAFSFALPAAGEDVESHSERKSPGVWKDKVFRWHYNPENSPSWLKAEEAKSLMIEAAAQWEACGIKMQYVGDTDRAPGVMDGCNVAGWSRDISPKFRGITKGQARAGRLLERDVAIRPDRREFELYPRLLKKVIIHEFGHAVGLTHSPRCDDIMTLAAECPRVHPSKLPNTLTENDLKRCRELY